MAELQIRCVPYREAYALIEPMLQDHFDEVRIGDTFTSVQVDHDKYGMMDACGSLFILVMHIGDRMAGYSSNFLIPHLHHNNTLVCSNDALFVAQEFRKGRNGLRLIEATEQFARDCGATVVSWNAKEGSALYQLLRRLPRYRVHEVVFSKEV